MKSQFVEKFNFKVDLEKIALDLKHVESQAPWPEKRFQENGRDYHANQIGLTHRPGAEKPWYDANGTLFNKQENFFMAEESDFTEWNQVGSYTKQCIIEFGQSYQLRFGRIRYMKLLPKTGLSIHADRECRYHLAIQTSPKSLFLDCTPEGNTVAKGYHIPADGYFYKVDTTKEHTVFNGGWEPRIHLVITELK
jgi:Aspartyl/Asparaginyl beta-hydroxylase